MIIDIKEISEKGIDIDEVVSFDDTYIKKTPIKRLDNIKVKGRIFYNITNDIELTCHIDGDMILEDSITLEDVSKKLDLDIEEIIENSQKTLDIIDILWQNIVLEVPISVRANPSKVYDLKGEGWELVDSDKKESKNTLGSILENLDEEGKE